MGRDGGDGEAMWDWVALVFGVGAVIALFASALRADKEIAATKERAARLEQETATAKLEQERLKQQLAWRRLTKSEHNQIVVALHGSPLHIILAFETGDPEAADYAGDIYQALTDAGMTVQWSPEIRTGGGLLYGVIVWPMANGEEARLKAAFAAAGIPTGPSNDIHAELKVTVASKPRPF
jgi:hypothetical protein